MPLLDDHLTLNLNHLPQTTTKYHYSVLGLTSSGMQAISMQGYILLITLQYIQGTARESQQGILLGTHHWKFSCLSPEGAAG